MDARQAREAAARLLAVAPPAADAVLLDDVEDHGWCFVLQWTADAPQPGIGPVGIDKRSGAAFYLSSQPLPVAVDLARSARGGVNAPAGYGESGLGAI